MWSYVYGALTAVERPVGDGTDDHVWGFLDYRSYNFQIGGNGKKFYCAFNDFQHVGFTFKVGLRITHQTLLMAFNFGMAIYIVGKLMSR